MSTFGPKRTCPFALHMSANDPKRTSIASPRLTGLLATPPIAGNLRIWCGYSLKSPTADAR
jgi:hypothetical protein